MTTIMAFLITLLGIQGSGHDNGVINTDARSGRLQSAYTPPEYCDLSCW